MLTPDEQHFLDHLSPAVANKQIVIRPYSDKVKEKAEEVMSSIRKAYPDLDVRLMGAAGLGISGQNDIDIYILSKGYEFEKYLPGLKKLFGMPKSTNQSSIAWKFTNHSHDVELYLTDPDAPTTQRQIKVFETLKSNPALLQEYEKLKQSLNGSTYKEYQTKKYEFYNRLLRAPQRYPKLV